MCEVWPPMVPPLGRTELRRATSERQLGPRECEGGPPSSDVLPGRGVGVRLWLLPSFGMEYGTRGW